MREDNRIAYNGLATSRTMRHACARPLVKACSSRLDIQIQDRLGRPVDPEEWFLVPLNAINDAVAKIKDGTISKYVYDPGQARLIEVPQ